MDEIDLLQLADFSTKVLVVGNITLNINVDGAYNKIAAEAPIPVHYETTRTRETTGVANVVKNLLALGIDVDLISAVGIDGDIVRETLIKEKIRTDNLVALDGYVPETVTRYFEDSVRLFQSRQSSFVRNSEEAEELILKKCKEQLNPNGYSAVLLVEADGDDAFSNELTQSLVHISTGYNIPVIGRPCKDRLHMIEGVDYIIANTSPASYNNATIKPNGNEELETSRHMGSNFNVQKAILMLSESGITWFLPNNNCTDVIPIKTGVSKQHGTLQKINDAAIAALGFSVARGLSHEQSLALITICVGYITKANNKTTLNLIDILPNKVIKTTEQLNNFVKFLPKNKKVVLTTGCFDLLHAGHVDNLRMAKELGDILIVLLNSDRSVKELKGPSRPVYSQEDRMKILSSVEFVDFIVLFDERRPTDQTRLINPDIFVKGREYTEERLRSDYPFLKQVVTVPMTEDHSTTGTLARIRGDYL